MLEQAIGRNGNGAMGRTTETMTLLTGGFALIVLGCVAANPFLAGAGVVALVLARVLHRSARGQLSRDLQDWALEAVEGFGPCPPALVRVAIAEEITSDDFKPAFQAACRAWALGHRAPMAGVGALA